MGASLDPPVLRHAALAGAVDAALDQYMGELATLVRIPSVSSLTAHRSDVEKTAEAVATLFSRLGLEIEMVRSGGLPAVLARRPAPPGAPTVLLYAHHDVQPVGDQRLWDTGPFDPVLVGDRLFARGSADDKAGVIAHFAAIAAHGDNLPVGVTVLIDGEEEIGSPTLPSLIESHREELTSDVIVIADSVNWALGVPALTTTLRGLVEVTVELRTLDHPLHAGAWGGPIPDALTTLIQLLATLHDDEGSVAVDGLLRATPSPATEYSESGFRVDAGVLEKVRLWGSGTLTERLWLRPSLTVTGIDGPEVAGAPGALSDSARARISIRIAPGDSPDDVEAALIRHLKTHNRTNAQLTFNSGPRAHPTSLDLPSSVRAAALSALSIAWGSEPVEIGVGGTLPLIHLFRSAYPDAAVLVTGVQDPDSRAHGPNESLHIPEFRNACVAEALLLDMLSAVEARAERS